MYHKYRRGRGIACEPRGLGEEVPAEIDSAIVYSVSVRLCSRSKSRLYMRLIMLPLFNIPITFCIYHV